MSTELIIALALLSYTLVGSFAVGVISAIHSEQDMDLGTFFLCLLIWPVILFFTAGERLVKRFRE